MKPSGILSFWQVPEDAGDPDIKVYVNGELVETGGGSSDFTTCTVTPKDKGLYAEIPIIANDVLTMSDPDGVLSAEVPLYKGTLVMNFPNAYFEVDVSGNATYDSGTGELVITGDCQLDIDHR